MYKVEVASYRAKSVFSFSLSHQHKYPCNSQNGTMYGNFWDTFTTNNRCFFTGVTIGFEPAFYSVEEDAGLVVLFVRVLAGELQRPAVINFSTVDGIGLSKICLTRVIFVT